MLGLSNFLSTLAVLDQEAASFLKFPVLPWEPRRGYEKPFGPDQISIGE